jgi:hypothetical protein
MSDGRLSGFARSTAAIIPGSDIGYKRCVFPVAVTQRGNRRQQTFFNDGDYAAYLELMVEWCNKEGVW